MRRREKAVAWFVIQIIILLLLVSCSPYIADLPGNGTEQTDSMEWTSEEKTAGELTEDKSSTEETTGEVTTEESPTEESPTEETPEEESSAETILPDDTSTEEHGEPIVVEQSLDEVKSEVLTVYPGSGDGQVGYAQGVYNYGPDSFAVENGCIYLLDAVNDRIILYEEGEYSYIDISECYNPVYMKYQNERFGIVDSSRQATAVYSKDGTLEAMVMHPEEIFPSGLRSVGETYVDWYAEDVYRYDWIKETLEKAEFIPETVSLSVQAPSSIDIIGSFEGEVYYVHTDVSAMATKVYKENVNGDRWYVTLADGEYFRYPLENVYLSEEGKLYLMESFEDRTVISELILGNVR